MAGEMTPQEREAFMAQTMGVPAPVPSPLPSNVKPGDPGFAASVLSTPAATPTTPTPLAPTPSGPAPGDPNFTFANVAAPPASPSAPQPAPGQPVIKSLPAGAGQVDTSGVTPKGFSSGAVSIPNLPPGAGQIDMSGTKPGVQFLTPKAPGEAAGAATAPGINWGGAGGGGIIPAHEQALALPARQKAVMDAITAQGDAVDAEGKALDEQKVAAGAEADANANLETQRGVGEIDAARAALDAGKGVKERAAKAADEAKVYRDRINEFSDKVAKDKIDPNGLWNNASTGQKITWTIAKMLGAVAQSFLHLPTNQVADELERMAAQDVAAQKANHEIGRERVADMNTMYGQAMHATGNAEEAERVATGYALEAAKHQAQAFVHSATSDVQKAKGKELVADLSARQAALGERKAIVQEKAAEKGIAMNPLVQARAAGGGVDMAKVYKDAREYVKDQAALGTLVPPDAAIRWAYKMNTGRDPLRNAGAFVGGAKADGANKEQRETQTATDEFNRQMDNLRNNPIITGTGLTEAALSNLPQRVAPDSNDAQQQLNSINTRMLQAIGKVAKDADGKPNKTMIEKIEKNFEIHLSDSPAIKQQKLQGIADVYNSLAREQGAKAPEPTAGTSPTFQK